MKAGALRHRVVVQQDTGTTQDAQGHVTESWATYATRWASIEPLSARELWNARQLQPDITHRVRMRWDSLTDAITSKMRIQYDTTRYLYLLEPPRKVQAERDIEIEMLCREAK